MKFNKINNLNNDHYVVASNKMYCVGNQDGSFSPLGFHVQGKMSGIFAQPIRIASGYSVHCDGTEAFAKEYQFENGNSTFIYDEYKVQLCAVDDEHAMILSVSGDKEIEVHTKLELEGCWTAEECGISVGKTQIIDCTDDFVLVKHEVENWFAAIYVNNGRLQVEQDGTVIAKLWKNSELIMAVSLESKERLACVASHIAKNTEQVIKSQSNRRSKLANKTNVITGKEDFDTAFESLKINYDMMIQQLPNVGEGYIAGYPDFQWFFGCDTTYGIHGTLSVGQHEETKRSLRLLKKLSEQTNGNGRVIHEISPFGLVYNEGNLQETPHFITAVYETYKWTGDREFLEEMIDFCIDGMKWVETKTEAGIYCPKGPGIVEVNGVDGRLIDIAILTIDAYKQLAYLCNESGRTECIPEYQQKQKSLEKEVIERFYSKEQQFFGDILCTKQEIEASKETLIHSIKNTKTLTTHMQSYFDQLLSKEYKHDALIPVVLKNWISILPYAKEFVPKEIKEKGISIMEGPEFYNEYGMKLGCMCDDRQDPVNDIYTLNKSMSINTGYLAEVFANNRKVDRAFELLMDLVHTMDKGMPGAISEILPDDGCFMQFWSGYGIHHVFLRNILGILPDAPNKQIIINPTLPKQLDQVSIKQLLVGECLYDIVMIRDGNEIKVTVEKEKEDYNVIIH